MRPLHNFLSGACLALSLAGCETFTPDAPSSAQIQQDEGILEDSTNVVVLVRTHEQADTLLVNAAHRGYQLNERTNLEALEMIMLDFKRPSGVSGDIAISDMKKMEPSATAGLDHFYTLQSKTTNNTGTLPRLYAQTMLDWPANGCTTNIPIGMIDGTVNPSNLSSRDAVIIAKNFSNGTAGASDHGTAIAELLVGNGRLSGASLYSASVVAADNSDQQGAGVFELVRAINWLQSENVPLVNISLAGPYNAILERVIQRASRKGMIMIAAVGNHGPDAKPRYPAAFNAVIAVTAIDSSRNIYRRAVRGDHVDFSAPGVDVFVNNGPDAKYRSGTSLAAPFVTALIASDIYLSTEDDISNIRIRMSAVTEDLGPSGYDPVYGRGLVRSTSNCTSPAPASGNALAPH